MSDHIDDYTYDLPPELIAREPPARRDEARLLVVDRATGQLTDSRIADLPEWLRTGDRLVLNNSRVVAARLVGVRTRTGAKWEGLFLRERGDGAWELLGKTRGKLIAGETVTIPATIPSFAPLVLELVEKNDEGAWFVRPRSEADREGDREGVRKRSAFDWLAEYGRVPLPPYMEREPESGDRERYQTTYAAVDGSVAAPTAGLHFTPELLARCAGKGVAHDFVTLHVGIGTFRPVAVERLADHVMHYETCELTDEVAAHLAETRAAGGRIVAVGTTSVRTLETAASVSANGGEGSPRGYRGETNLFIRPPYQFRSVDALLTNFHLPRSTLLVLVSCLAGRELMLRAYEHAIRERYRFFSYGDAMLIV